jgi:hypothetical protein
MKLYCCFILIINSWPDGHQEGSTDWSGSSRLTYDECDSVIGGLFIKNVISEKALKALTKEELIRILKLIRKDKYLVYKQIATFAINISQQMKGNINQQAIEQFINGP